jgi:hypothetical protein
VGKCRLGKAIAEVVPRMVQIVVTEAMVALALAHRGRR